MFTSYLGNWQLMLLYDHTLTAPFGSMDHYAMSLVDTVYNHRLKQRKMTPSVEPHAPQALSKGIVSSFIRLQLLTRRTWRLFFSPPKINCLFRNVTAHDLYTSCSLKSNVVDTSPAVSISRGVLLSIVFFEVSFSCFYF